MNIYTSKQYMLFDNMQNKNVILITMLLVFAMSGCAQITVRPQEPETMSLLNTRLGGRQTIFENFNNEKGINQRGGASTIVPEGSPSLVVAYKRENGFRGAGKYCEMKFDLAPHAIVTWKTNVSNYDISQAEDVAFLLRLDQPETASAIYMSLEDKQGNSASVACLEHIVPLEFPWFEVVIPRALLQGIDFNQIESFMIKFKANESRMKGTIGIDSLSFLGQRQIVFASKRDNLKGFPTLLLHEKQKQNLLKRQDKELLQGIAEDTWRYFQDIVDKKTGLPIDWIKIDKPQRIGAYTSPTNIGLYIVACIGARDLFILDNEETKTRINACLSRLEEIETWNGFFYNYYSTRTLKPTDLFVSTVDCGWLAAGLIMARQTFPGTIADRATKLLTQMDFSKLYDANTGHLWIGYDTEKKEFESFHYGLLVSEARVTSLIAIGKGDIDKEHWFKMFRVLPEEHEWQTQKPQGSEQKYLGYTVFEGYYTYKDKKIVPSWGGSLFEFLMPTLVIDESGLAPEGLGLNNKIATQIHMDYALNENDCGVWGLSPCSVAGNKYGGYAEFGVPGAGVKGYKSDLVITPHVSFLALDVLPQQAIDNIRNMLSMYDIYGPYGLYDSITIAYNEVSYKYLALDQAMTFVSIVNYLNNNSLKKRFQNDPIMKNVEELIAVEKFFK